MTIKTVVTYSCSLLSILIIIISLATNYWYEYERTNIQTDEPVSRSRAGLWEICTIKIMNHLTDDEEKEDMGCEDYEPLEGVENWSATRNAVVITYILAVLLTVIGFAFVTVYCVTNKYYFPVKRTAVCFGLAGLMILIGLAVYTSKFIELEVSFSWSYGAGWSVVGMYVISIILLFADK